MLSTSEIPQRSNSRRYRKQTPFHLFQYSTHGQPLASLSEDIHKVVKRFPKRLNLQPCIWSMVPRQEPLSEVGLAKRDIYELALGP